MKKAIHMFYFLLMLAIVTINAKAATIYKEEKLHTGWFNHLGGLDNIMTGSAVLTIDKDGGVTIKDNFNVFADYIGNHWVTVDEIFRAKDWKNDVLIFATFHHINRLDGKEYEYQGNGSFDFPSSGVAHIVSGGSSNIEIVDLYAQAHLSDQNNIEGDGDQQNNGQDSCSIDSRISKEEVVNQTFLEFKKGLVYIKPVGCNSWIKAVNNLKLKPRDLIKTGKNGRASIVLQGTSFVKLRPNSKLLIKYDPELKPKKTPFLELVLGVLWAHAKKEKNALKVATPHAICGVKDTEFEVSYINKTSCVHALRHSVWFSDIQKRKTVIVHEGEKSCIERDEVPSLPVPIENSSGNIITKHNISGKWNSNFGEITFKQSGNKIEGFYTHDSGRIRGTLKSNTFIGRWMEAPTYKPPHDAGDVKFIFSKDGKSFSGKWRYGLGGNSWNGDWQGHRILRKGR
jgi:hypothetical protein